MADESDYGPFNSAPPVAVAESMEYDFGPFNSAPLIDRELVDRDSGLGKGRFLTAAPPSKSGVLPPLTREELTAFAATPPPTPQVQRSEALKAERYRIEDEQNQDDFTKLLTGIGLGLGSGIHEVKREVGGLFQGKLGRIVTVGPILGPLFSKPLGESGKEISDAAIKEQQLLEEQSAQLGGTGQRFLKQVADPAVPSLASIAAAPAGLPGIALLAGLQSYGGTLDEATRAGYDKPELPALINGVVTAGLTRTMGGVEKFVADLATGKIKRLAAEELIHSILHSALSEFPEEGLDQLSQGVVAKLTYEPTKPWQGIIDEAIKAGAVGALYGGVGAAVAGSAAQVGTRVADKLSESDAQKQLTQSLEAHATEVARLYNDPKFQNDPRFDKLLGPEKRNITPAKETGEAVSADNIFRIAQFVVDRMGDSEETATTKRYLEAGLANPTSSTADGLAQVFGYTIDNAVKDLPSKFLNMESRMAEVKGTTDATVNVGVEQQGSEQQHRGTATQVQEVGTDRTDQTQVQTESTGDRSGDIVPESGQIDGVSPDAKPPLKGTVSFAREGENHFSLPAQGNFDDVVNLFPKDIKKEQRALLKALAPFVKDVPYAILESLPEQIPGRTSVGLFLGNKIALSASDLANDSDAAIRTILHEYVHAATFWALSNKYNVLYLGRLGALMNQAKARWDRSKTDPAFHDQFDYAFSNVDEFVAAALTDRAFQRMLSGLTLEKSRKTPGAKNVFKYFVKLLSDLFGIKDPTILEETIRQTDELLRQKASPRRELGAGTVIAPPSAIQTSQESALQAEKVVRTANERARESNQMMAQTNDTLDALERVGAGDLEPGAGNLLGYSDLLGISTVAQRMAGGMARNYQQLKAGATKHDLVWYARAAFVGWQRFEDRVKRLTKERDDLLAQQIKPGFQNLVTKVGDAKLRKELAADMLRIAQSVFSSALDLTRKVLQQEKHGDLEIATLEGRIRQLSETQRSPVAMQQVIDDMVTVLSSTSEGLALLRAPQSSPLFIDPENNPRRQMVQVYKDLKRTTGQPLHNDTLIQWASFVIKKNQDLTDDLLAAHLASTSQVRAALNPFQASFMAAYDKNPATAVRGLLKSTKALVTERDKAAFVWQRLDRKLNQKLSEFALVDSAVTVGQAALADPQTRAIRTEVNHDVQLVGKQKPFIPHIDSTLILPDGEQIDVSVRMMIGAKDLFAQNRKGWEAAAKKLENWLADPDNFDHPDYETHRRNLQSLQALFIHQSILQPNDPLRWAKRSFDRIWSSVEQIGGRVAAQLKFAVRDYEFTRQRAEWWNQRTTAQLALKLIAAMKSHGMKWSSLTDQTMIDAADQWHRQVGNQLKTSWNVMFGGSMGGAMGVGDTLGSGQKITVQDFEYLKAESRATSEGFELAGESQVTEETLGDIQAFRKALKGSRWMTTRTFDDRYLRSFAQPASDAYQAYVATEDPAIKARALSQFKAAFNASWSPEFAHAWVWDRNPQFVKEATPLDGQDGPFRQAAAQIESAPNSLPDWDSLVNFLAGVSALTPAEVADTLIKDWGKLTQTWRAEAEADPLAPTVTPVESSTPFTKSRNDQIAPYIFYRNGFRHSHDVGTFAVGIFKTRLDKMLAGFRLAAEDIQRQMSEFQQAKNKAQAAGVKDFESKAIEANAEERRNGDTYDYYQNLERRLKFAEDTVRQLSAIAQESDVDMTMARVVGDIAGMMISGTVTTATNVSTGPIFLGMLAMKLNGSSIRSFTQAIIQAFIIRQVIALTATTASVAKAVGFDMARGGIKALVDLQHPEMRNVRSFTSTLFSDFIKELAEHGYNRIWRMKKYQDAGLLNLPQVVNEFNARLLGTIAGAGRVGELGAKQTSKVKRGVLGLLGLAELFTTSIFKAYAQTWGDVAINQATADMVMGSMGLAQQMEGRLKDLFLDFQKMGVIDRNHRFSAREVFPSVWTGEQLSVPRLIGGSDTDMYRLREIFLKAGMGFDDKANQFIDNLTRDPKAQFLTDDERYALADAAINEVNRASPANQPLNLRTKNFINTIVSPFMFWATRKTADFVDHFEVAALIESGIGHKQALKTARAAQWAMAMAFIVFPIMLFSGFIGKPLQEEEARALKRLLYNQITASRQFWERQTPQQQVGGLIQNMAGAAPFLESVAMLAFNDIPNRASLDRNLAVVEKLKDAIRYVGGVAQTGDITYKLSDFIGSLIPDSKLFLNRLPSQEGRREANNVLALLRRNAPTDMLRPMGGSSGGASATPLTPLIGAMENAAVRGDDDTFAIKYRAAVTQAREMGKPDPERYVRELYAARSVYNRALSKKFTPAERRAFMEKLSPEDAEAVGNYERAFARAGQRIGANITFENEGSGGGGGGSGTFASGIRVSGGGGGGPRTPFRSALASRRKAIARSRTRTRRSRIATFGRGGRRRVRRLRLGR